MPATIKIRDMTRKDLDGVYAVQVSAFSSNFLEPLSAYVEMLAHYSEVSYVAECEGKIVGYLSAYPSDEERDDFDKGSWDIRGDEECLYIDDLCIDPTYQGIGIAKMLFQRGESQAKSLGFKKFVGISVQNTSAFWEKRGFTMVRPYSYNGEDGILMVKELMSCSA